MAELGNFQDEAYVAIQKKIAKTTCIIPPNYQNISVIIH